jgi:FkbM family methyltransferase
MPIYDKFMTGTTPVIVEVGAGNGHMLAGYLSSHPKAIIYAFEPVQSLFETLADKYKKKENVHLYQQALGTQNEEIYLNIHNREIASSVHTRTREMQKTFRTTHVDKVECCRLDTIKEITSLDHIDLLNIITEGSELQVLKGSIALLTKIRVIKVQAFFYPVYVNQDTYYDIDNFLRNEGFNLFNIHKVTTLPRGQLVRCQITYIKSNLEITK